MVAASEARRLAVKSKNHLRCLERRFWNWNCLGGFFVFFFDVEDVGFLKGLNATKNR